MLSVKPTLKNGSANKLRKEVKEVSTYDLNFHHKCKEHCQFQKGKVHPHHQKAFRKANKKVGAEVNPEQTFLATHRVVLFRIPTNNIHFKIP